MASAKRFFTQAKEVVGHKPSRVTTDGHNSYPRAIRSILGRKLVHRTNRLALIELPYYRVEQDHRGIKQRYYSRKIYEV
ncbi:MAG: DDE-type integrase/transposase/recombinase [Chloroflexota bacterium]